MALRYAGESFAVLVIVLLSTLPGAIADLVGGQIIPECSTVDTGTVNCNTVNANCVGNMVVCQGCGTGSKTGLCASNESGGHPCGGAVGCFSFLNSLMVTNSPTGQACVPQQCPPQQGP